MSGGNSALIFCDRIRQFIGNLLDFHKTAY
jgi:hypothetical protein